MSDDKKVLKAPAEFFSAPKESTVLAEVQKQMQSTESGLLDQVQLRQQEDWGVLAAKVVGAEGE